MTAQPYNRFLTCNESQTRRKLNNFDCLALKMNIYTPSIFYQRDFDVSGDFVCVISLGELHLFWLGIVKLWLQSFNYINCWAVVLLWKRQKEVARKNIGRKSREMNMSHHFGETAEYSFI